MQHVSDHTTRIDMDWIYKKDSKMFSDTEHVDHGALSDMKISYFLWIV